MGATFLEAREGGLAGHCVGGGIPLLGHAFLCGPRAHGRVAGKGPSARIMPR